MDIVSEYTYIESTLMWLHERRCVTKLRIKWHYWASSLGNNSPNATMNYTISKLPAFSTTQSLICAFTSKIDDIFSDAYSQVG